MMYEILRRIERLFDMNENNADRKDVMRSATTASAIGTWAQALDMLGHKTEHGDWDDDGCLRCGYLKIDEVEIIKNGKFNYDAWCKMCHEFKEEN